MNNAEYIILYMNNAEFIILYMNNAEYIILYMNNTEYITCCPWQRSYRRKQSHIEGSSSRDSHKLKK